jgi:DNA-binding response OmpR family regulator
MKIEPDASEPTYVRTVYGVGYTFDGPGRKPDDA